MRFAVCREQDRTVISAICICRLVDAGHGSHAVRWSVRVPDAIFGLKTTAILWTRLTFDAGSPFQSQDQRHHRVSLSMVIFQLGQPETAVCIWFWKCQQRSAVHVFVMHEFRCVARSWRGYAEPWATGRVFTRTWPLMWKCRSIHLVWTC